MVWSVIWKTNQKKYFVDKIYFLNLFLNNNDRNMRIVTSRNKGYKLALVPMIQNPDNKKILVNYLKQLIY